MAQTTYIPRKGQDADFANVTASGTLAVGGLLTALGIRDTATQVLTATGAITIDSGTVTLAHATVVIAATLDAPTANDTLLILNNSASGTAAHTVTLPGGVSFVGGSSTIATFDAPGEALFMRAISATKWFIIANVGSVALS